MNKTQPLLLLGVVQKGKQNQILANLPIAIFLKAAHRNGRFCEKGVSGSPQMSLHGRPHWRQTL